MTTHACPCFFYYGSRRSFDALLIPSRNFIEVLLLVELLLLTKPLRLSSASGHHGCHVQQRNDHCPFGYPHWPGRDQHRRVFAGRRISDATHHRRTDRAGHWRRPGGVATHRTPRSPVRPLLLLRATVAVRGLWWVARNIASLQIFFGENLLKLTVISVRGAMYNICHTTYVVVRPSWPMMAITLITS